ncbi:MAG: DUF4919 domain-containing protein [Planctomycetes bacterium]|nr:DUF4919 domain-containing protein [Planctomycetota bacterium]
MPDDDQFMQFLKEPSYENYVRVRNLVLAHPAYDPYGNQLNEAMQLLDKSDWAGFIDKGRELIPNFLLSPRFHLARSFALKQLGDEDSADMEAAMYVCCIEGIRSTGDGSEDKPWLVLRTLDEYDMLEQMGKKSAGQSLHSKDDRSLDRIQCEDGSAYWFDVTDAFKKLSDDLKP